tara:strand:+ start:119 stop:232 length:114 start_codon:yes stop_codon:yes gene_type:complete
LEDLIIQSEFLDLLALVDISLEVEEVVAALLIVCLKD